MGEDIGRDGSHVIGDKGRGRVGNFRGWEGESGGGRGRAMGTKVSNSGTQAVSRGQLLSQVRPSSLELGFKGVAACSGSIGSSSGGANPSFRLKGGGRTSLGDLGEPFVGLRKQLREVINVAPEGVAGIVLVGEAGREVGVGFLERGMRGLESGVREAEIEELSLGGGSSALGSGQGVGGGTGSGKLGLMVRGGMAYGGEAGLSVR